MLSALLSNSVQFQYVQLYNVRYIKLYCSNSYRRSLASTSSVPIFSPITLKQEASTPICTIGQSFFCTKEKPHFACLDC